jgi:hypothetical protein
VFPLTVRKLAPLNDALPLILFVGVTVGVEVTVGVGVSVGVSVGVRVGVGVGVGVGVSLNKDQTTFPFRYTLVAEEPLKYILLLFPNKLILINYNV